MVQPSGIQLNRLFEVLAEWDTILKAEFAHSSNPYKGDPDGVLEETLSEI